MEVRGRTHQGGCRVRPVLPGLGTFLCLTLSCGVPAETSRPRDARPLAARFRLEPGDAFAVEIRILFEGSHGKGGGTIESSLKVDEVGPSGEGKGTFTISRLKLSQGGPTPTEFVYENGKLKVVGEMQSIPARSIESQLARPMKVVLHPGGAFRLVGPNAMTASFLFGPLGIYLPAGQAGPGARWKGVIQSAHCDAVETEYRVSQEGARMKIQGASTPEAEKQHRIRVRHEGTFLRDEGYVSDSRIEIDFSALNIDRKVTAEFRISRRG